MKKLLIANRGEIAIRVARAAEALGIATVAIASEDDAGAPHARRTGEVHVLRGEGPPAYLDAEAIVRAAAERGCDAVHPGYGFLAESAAFARRCAAAGLVFVGPRPEQIEAFGDKLGARAIAARLGVPVARATERVDDGAAAAAFLGSLGGAPAMIKAVAGGGGRGSRVVRAADELGPALERARSEARAAFGEDSVYLEEVVPRARHVEVQLVGDRSGHVVHLHERECTLQRRRQKVVEIAPSPSIGPALREQLAASALRMAREVGLESLGTFEFLVGEDGRFVFLEVNPRIQVEHTVTEELLGVDLVQAQLRIADGATLEALGLVAASARTPEGHAIELRLSLERVHADGTARAHGDGARLARFEMPSGPGVRIDGCGHAGYVPNPRFDPLVAKIVVRSRSPRFEDAAALARRALREARVDGVPSNLGFLRAIAADPAFAANAVHTTWLEEHAGRLAESAAALEDPPPSPSAEPPRAVRPPAGSSAADAIDGVTLVRSPLAARVASVEVAAGSAVRAGDLLAVLESMKMESAIAAPCAGVVLDVEVRPGAAVREGDVLVRLAPGSTEDATVDAVSLGGGDGPREDLARMRERRARIVDAGRAEAVARRHAKGKRTARENVEDLFDRGSFVEYGAFALAAQRATRSVEELVEKSPADGLVCGFGTVNAAAFGDEAARCAVAAYDYTVFAGTQGAANHKKQDRLFELASRRAIPVVLFAEGGGGRPGDTDMQVRSMLDVPTFARFAALSGTVPLVGVVSGRCFAGNAALLGCCDVIVATEDANVGMGGPVMIEGAGLGRFPAEAIGPIDVQWRNGVVDVRVADEVEATRVARAYLAYFQGRVAPISAAEGAGERLRAVVPESRKRVYDMRAVIADVADAGSVLELRGGFGRGMITALARIEGRAVGVFANDPTRLAGAIDAEAADKASRFMRLCDAFGIPLVAFCDTPGFMVGPEAEETALVRRVCRMLVAGARIEVPVLTVITRKAFGLGAMAMCAGGTQAPFATVAWPSGELGAMGIEGAVSLAFRRELEAIADPAERERTLRARVAAMREQGTALHSATHVEIDDVIDPADTRRWLARGLAAAGETRRLPARRAFVDPW